MFPAIPKVTLLNDRFSNISTMRGFNHDELAMVIEGPVLLIHSDRDSVPPIHTPLLFRPLKPP